MAQNLEGVKISKVLKFANDTKLVKNDSWKSDIEF